jgi:hypothetical protein
MANICRNRITVIGSQEAPEVFLKTLSKAMFGIDLDTPNLEQWGLENRDIDSSTWYELLEDRFRTEGRSAAMYCVLYVDEPYENVGVRAPRFYVETKNEPPVHELSEASKNFPELTFHLQWHLLQDGPSGEAIIHNGSVNEELVRNASWYLFDTLIFPMTSLLPAHLPLTLAQRAGQRMHDAVGVVDSVIRILDDRRFTNSPFSQYRDAKKTVRLHADLSALRASIAEGLKQLDFEGVFLENSASATKDSGVLGLTAK